MLKSDLRIDSSSSLTNPFKGRTLLRSPKAKPVQTISIQYDYQNKTPPSPIKVEEKAEKVPSPSPVETEPRNRMPTRTPPQSKGMAEEEKMKRNYIPKGNMLARTPPPPSDTTAGKFQGETTAEQRDSLPVAATRKNSIDYLKPPLHASRLERLSMREYFEYEKDLLNSDLQNRLDNATTKLDTGRVPVSRAKRKANKGVQVSLLKIPLPKSESPSPSSSTLSSQDNKVRKLPDISDDTTSKKSKPYLKARKGRGPTVAPPPKKSNADSSEEDKAGMVEEFVLNLRMIKRKDGSHEIKEVEMKPVGSCTGSGNKTGKKGTSKKSTLPVRTF